MKPQTQEELDAWNHTGDDCDMCGPSWWGMQRGCYKSAMKRYADGAPVKAGKTYREVVTGAYPNTNGARAFIDQEEI